MKKILALLLIGSLCSVSAFAADPKAKRVKADTTNFDNNLSAADDTVQKALETLDDQSGSGDITSVWTDLAGDVSAMTAGAGDTLDASGADSTVPWEVDTTATPTTEGEAIWDSDGDNLAIGDGSSTVIFYPGAHTTDTNLTQEEVEDFAGAMVTGNTETLITVTYQDADGTVDYVVDEASIDHDALTNFAANEHIDWTGASAGTIHATNYVDSDTQLTQEQVEDYSGGMWTGNTETRATVTYQDADGTIDIVVDDMNDDVPESGDFGNADDLESTGELSADVVDQSKIADDAIQEEHFKAVNVAVDEDIVTYEATTGDFEYHTCAEITGSADLCDGVDDGGAEVNNLETTDPPNVQDTEIYIGNGAGSGAWAALSGDATMANTGAVTVADNSHDHTESNISDLTHTTDTNLTQEEVEDFAGALVADGTGTHTGIAVTYQDATGDVDMVVDHDGASNFTSTEHFTMLDEDTLVTDSNTQAATQQSIKAYVDGQDHADHGDGANCAAGEIALGVDASGAVQGCYEPSEADISDLAHTATAITDGLIIEADLNEDSGTPTDEDILTYDSTGANFNWVAQSTVAAGTAVALAANGSNCAAGEVALGVDAAGAVEGCYEPAAGDIASGTLAHERGGLELDISTVGIGDVIAGASAGTLEIVDGGAASDGDVLTIQADGTANFETPAGGGSGAFSDAGDPVVLNTTTKDVVIGTTHNDSAKLGVDGDADQIQLHVQGHSTQGADVVLVEDSDGIQRFLTVDGGASNEGRVIIGTFVSSTADGPGDLYVNDEFEVDGASQFDGDITVSASTLTLTGLGATDGLVVSDGTNEIFHAKRPASDGVVVNDAGATYDFRVESDTVTNAIYVDGDNNTTGLGQFVFDITQSVGVGQDNYVLTYDDTGGKISLEASAGGGSGDAVTVNSTAADTTADFADNIYVDFTHTDGGAGGPDTVNSVFNYNAATGDHSLSANELAFAANGLVVEGATADTIESYVQFGDPATSDKTITFFNATDTVVGRDTTDTLTNKTINTASNTITVVEADISDLSHTTDTQADEVCSGTTTYLDGEGNCDDISSVYEPAGITESDISDLDHTATAITDGLIVEADLNEDSGTPTDEDILTYDSTGANFNWVAQSTVAAGTAAALAANGANCAAGEIALGVDASGAVEGCYEPTEADISDLSHTTDTNLTQEEVEDFAGGLVSNATGTHTRITVTYQDATGDMDLVVDDMNDDVPDAGDFGAATDLDANGAVAWGNLAEGELTNDAIVEADLKVVDTPSDEECLTYEVTTGDFEWQSCGAGSETNDLEGDGAANIADTEVFIGTGAGTGNYAAISGDATLANTGALTIAADAIEESMLKSVNSPTDEYVLTYESTTGDFEWEEVHQAYRSFYVDAAAMAPRTTSGAAIDTTEHATNDVIVDQYLFDDTTEEGVQFKMMMPDDWDLGTIKAKFFWDTTGASGGVTWGLAGMSRADNDAIDNAFPSSVDTDDTVIAVGDVHVVVSAAVTVNSPALGEYVWFELTRVVGDTNDTMTGDAKLLGMAIQYGTLQTDTAQW